MNIRFISVFTVATAIFSSSLVWTLRYFEHDQSELIIRIPGSASGLVKNSWVLFNGIRVGYVENIWLDRDDPRWVIVQALINPETPLNDSAVADLIVSATGDTNIELSNRNNNEASLLDSAAEQGIPAIISANPSTVPNTPPARTFWWWLSTRTEGQMATIAFILLLSFWFISLLVIYWKKPSLLISLHERMPEPSKIDSTASLFEKSTFGGAKIICWVVGASLMSLATRPRALDAWISDRLVVARHLFEQRQSVRDRSINVDLPVKIDRTIHKRPWRELGRLMSIPSPTALLISGPGGAGKTTLAFEIARRALHGSAGNPWGAQPMIPLLVEADMPDGAMKPDGLASYAAGLLRTAVNEKRRITVQLTSALLQKGRLLVVVDGMSERSSLTRDTFNPQRQGFEILRLIVTSRDRNLPGMNSLVETESIPSGALFGFISDYLHEMEKNMEGLRPAEDEIFDACAKLKRLLADTPCTPLLAVLWAREIGAPVEHNQVRGVSSLMDNYVRRVLLPTANDDESQIDQLTKDASEIAALELGEFYQPGFITRSAALDLLRSLHSRDPEKRFAVLERSRLLESPLESDIVRISPDPVAEHLAARLLCEKLGNGETEWQAFLDALNEANLPQGFISALAACISDTVHGRKIPSFVSIEINSMVEKIRRYSLPHDINNVVNTN